MLTGLTFGWSERRCGKLESSDTSWIASRVDLSQWQGGTSISLPAAKRNGGDGLLLKTEQTDFLGTYSTDSDRGETEAGRHN